MRDSSVRTSTLRVGSSEPEARPVPTGVVRCMDSRMLVFWTMPLDLSSWKRALGSLERGIARSTSSPADEELRDAVERRNVD